MSAALAWSRVDMNMLNLGTSKFPGNLKPTDATCDRSCFFFLRFFFSGSALALPSSAWPWPCSCPCLCSSPQSASSHSSSDSSSSSRSGSMSVQRSRLKAPWLRISPRSTTLRLVSRRVAVWLMLRISSLTAASSSALTRSSLFSTMRSAKATCCTASLTAPSGLTSRRWAVTFLASTRHTMQSILKLSWIVVSLLKVWMIGAGSASPVVSRRMAWKSFRRAARELRVRTRSPRTVQQTHPLSMLTMSSLDLICSCTSPSSMLTSPNSFSMIAMRHSFCFVKM
mmetsp:Transcript_11058/g.16677  ORF Transcript_11058/g.16677 Transcript_11058/m.16677 type:complete len:283 (-) Transcript_11058:132-980(-)